MAATPGHHLPSRPCSAQDDEGGRQPTGATGRLARLVTGSTAEGWRGAARRYEGAGAGPVHRPRCLQPLRPARPSPGQGEGFTLGARGWTLPGRVWPQEGEVLKCCARAKCLWLNLPPPSQLLIQLFCASLFRDLISPVR